MKIMIVSPVFPPEPIVSSQTNAQIAEYLARMGHKVSIITSFPNRPAGKLYFGYKRKLFSKEVSTIGVGITRCFSTLSPESHSLSRFFENITFGLTSSWVVLVSKKPDVIYANTWPIFSTGILTIIAKLRNIPIVISVQDIYPESLVSQRRLNAEHVIVQFLRWIDGLIARNCQAIITISISFKILYQKTRFVPSEKVHYIPNWIDEKQTIPNNGGNKSIRAQYRMPDNAFVVVYAGNIGVAAGVEIVIEAFRYLQSEKNLYLVIAGEGSSLDLCRSVAEKINSHNIIFHTPWLPEETTSILDAADIFVLPTRGRQSIASVPSKLMSYMLAGKPILALGLPESDLTQSITISGCGWIVEPDRADLLAEKLLEIMGKNKKELERCGKLGRNYALQNYSKDALLPKVIDLLENIGNKK